MIPSSDTVFDDDVLERLDAIDRAHSGESAPREPSMLPNLGGTSVARTDSFDSDFLVWLDEIDPPMVAASRSGSNGQVISTVVSHVQPVSQHEPVSPPPPIRDTSSPAPKRSPRRNKRKRHLAMSDTSTSNKSSSPLHRLAKRRRSHSTSPDSVAIPRDAFVERLAEHSGSETSAGSASQGDEEDEEDEDDRRFVTDAGAVSPRSSSYDQIAVYHHSLLTQPAGEFSMPNFSNGPFRPNSMTNNRERNCLGLRGLSSSPPARARSSEPDTYELGSFVVPDDDSTSSSSKNSGTSS